MFYLWLGLCFTCFAFRTVFNVLIYKQNPLAKNKALLILIYIAMALLWFSWFQMNFFDPVRILVPLWLRITGAVIFATGVFLVVYSMIRLHGVEDPGKIIRKGIFARIRNPMYLGFILWVTGFPVFIQGLITLASSALWIPFLISWKTMEEKGLLKKYPEYEEYMERTWF